MISLKTCLLLLSLTTLALTVYVPPNYLFRTKPVSTPSHPYTFSPNFDYPLFQAVDKNLAQISDDVYPATFYSGYIPINNQGTYIYYLLYPAGGNQNAGATLNNSAPLVMWMQGGPGCADWLGNFGEVGPLQVVNTSEGTQEVIKRDVNWNSEYNLLFIDQPPGVGFSPSGGVKYIDSVQAADTVITFLQGLLNNAFPSLKSNPFYIFGESYGGHYIPAVASGIVAKKTTGINLKGVGIGDGLTDPANQGQSYAEFGFMAGFLDGAERDTLALIEQNMPVEFKKGNYSGIAALLDQITGIMVDPTITGVSNPYDYRDNGDEGTSPYSIYLNDQNVRKALALDPTIPFNDCVDYMYNDFYNDIGQSYASNITYLLDNGIPVVLYNGEDDIIINTLGARTWIGHLGWQYIHQFENSLTQSFQDSQQNIVGTIKSFRGFTFVVVYKAGHTVPGYQPVAAKMIIDNLINSQFSRPVEIDL